MVGWNLIDVVAWVNLKYPAVLKFNFKPQRKIWRQIKFQSPMW